MPRPLHCRKSFRRTSQRLWLRCISYTKGPYQSRMSGRRDGGEAAQLLARCFLGLETSRRNLDSIMSDSRAFMLLVRSSLSSSPDVPRWSIPIWRRMHYIVGCAHRLADRSVGQCRHSRELAVSLFLLIGYYRWKKSPVVWNAHVYTAASPSSVPRPTTTRLVTRPVSLRNKISSAPETCAAW